MWKLLFLLSFLLFPSPLMAQCKEEKAHLLSLLQQGMSRMRVSMEQTDASAILSPETKAGYRESAQWALAWTNDHAERLKENIAESGTVREGIVCGDLSEFAANVRVQWLPVAQKEQEMAVTRVLWDLDTFAKSVESADASDRLAKAREFFLRAHEAQSRQEWRILLRKGAFHVRIALRLLRKL